jgi:hypothetical protein
MSNLRELLPNVKFIVYAKLGYKYAVNLSNNKIHDLNCKHLRNAKRIKFLSSKQVARTIECGTYSLCKVCK